MEEKTHDRRKYDVLLEKVIQVTENNIKAQKEYLHELTLIKNRFDLNDRDHDDLKKQVNLITTNTFDIINKMNQASNEKIISMLEKNESVHTDFTYKYDKIYSTINTMNDKIDGIGIIQQNINLIDKKIDSVDKKSVDIQGSFLLIVRLLGAILILIAGVQIAATAWNTLKDQQIESSVEYIKEEVKN